MMITTVDTASAARRISKTLLQKRLAACVQVISGVNSSYWWKGKIAEDKELLLFIKTKKTLVRALERELTRVHPYTTPEIVALPAVFVGVKYAAWLEEVM